MKGAWRRAAAELGALDCGRGAAAPPAEAAFGGRALEFDDEIQHAGGARLQRLGLNFGAVVNRLEVVLDDGVFV